MLGDRLQAAQLCNDMQIATGSNGEQFGTIKTDVDLVAC